MYINNENLEDLISIENKLAQDKKYYNEFCVLSTMIEDLLAQKATSNMKNWERIKEKRKVNKNYAR